MKEKSYSQWSCCNSENSFQSENAICSAPVPTDTLPPTTAEPAPMPPEPAPMPRSDLIQIIIGAVAAAAAVDALFQCRRDNQIQHHHPNGAA